MLYKIFIRPVFYLLDPEVAHDFVLNLVSKYTFFYSLFGFLYKPKKKIEYDLCGMKFKNRLGLAAGFDKNGIAIRFWEAIGFSHIEVGTVTPLPQHGNEKPRIFRLKKDKAIINRLGFNNKGAEQVRSNILEARKHLSKDFIIGVNIGKNKETPLKEAVSDYKICFEKLYDAADYFTVNISSPNTEGLRILHEEEHLDKLLSELQKVNYNISQLKSLSIKCIFLKIAPDLNHEMIQLVYKIAVKNKVNGIVATNTTVERKDLRSGVDERGGLSGKPLKSMSDKVLKKLNELNRKNPDSPLKLIGVGGVFSQKDFNDKIHFGASIVQLYTGFIYEGPSIIKNVLKQP